MTVARDFYGDKSEREGGGSSAPQTRALLRYKLILESTPEANFVEPFPPTIRPARHAHRGSACDPPLRHSLRRPFEAICARALEIAEAVESASCERKKNN